MAIRPDTYFEQTRHGVSRWWSWIMVFWFTVLGWLAVQTILIIPALIAAQVSDPEIFNQLLESSTAAQAGESGAAIQRWSGLFQISTLLGILFWIANRFAHGQTRKIAGYLTAIAVTISFATMLMMAPHMSNPESGEIISRMIGLNAIAFAFFLLIFPASLIALYLGQRFIHKRGLNSLHTAAKRIRFGRGLQAFFITWLVLGIMTAILHFTGISPIKSMFGNGRFWGYAIVSLLLIPLQSGTEEIIFRGYLNQALHHFLKNKWVVFTITSLLFMAMHLSNPEALSGAEQGILPLVMSSYFIFGFVACLMVWMDNGLESAIGFHAANNTFAAIFVNYEGSVLPTPSLFMAKTNAAIDVPVTIIALGLIALILYKTRKPLHLS